MGDGSSSARRRASAAADARRLAELDPSPIAPHINNYGYDALTQGQRLAQPNDVERRCAPQFYGQGRRFYVIIRRPVCVPTTIEHIGRSKPPVAPAPIVRTCTRAD